MTRLWAFDDAACRELAAAHGTPTFAYSAAIARATWERLRAALPARVRLAYAVKANPLPELLGAFAALGASFDVASAGELGRLRAIGVPSDRIFFTGPAKRDAEVFDAVRRGVRLQAEGFEDLRRTDAAARRLGLDAVAVNLRVQPLGVEEAGHEGGSILGGSGPTAFGIDEEDLPAVLDAAAGLDRVRIRGLHGFAASNERDADRLLAHHRRMFTIGRRMRIDHGLRLEQVDLGGGLGVPYSTDQEALDVDRFGRGLDALIAEQTWFDGEVILEPGRFLAAPCGVYLARVVRTKESRGERFALLDGGIHHLIRPLLTGEPFPVRCVEPDLCERGPAVEQTLAGPLCTALDRLGRVDLPPLRRGDLLAFGQVGAYGATEAMTHFLDHPPAPEVWVSSPTAQMKGCLTSAQTSRSVRKGRRPAVARSSS